MSRLKTGLKIGLLIAGVLLTQVPIASADSRHGRREYGHVIHRIPRDFRPIKVGRESFFYGDGFFYRYTPRGYILVAPPVGAIVPILPEEHTTVLVQKTPYYVYEDTYYVTAPSGGYVVTAAPPVTEATQVPVTIEKKAPIDEYEIQIPNANGSYTLVVIRKTEKGFVGPQGEIYPEHPTVEQLKQMYAKK